MSTFPTKEKALGMYRKMYEIRKYEESIYYLFLEGIMPGTIHQSTGEEASAVGMLYDLRKEDWMASTHRPAGHDIAKGISVKAMMCEMFGAADGCCHGIGGAMHTGDISVGASNDIDRATKLARDMVARYGMCEKLGTVSYLDGGEVFIGRDYQTTKSYSEKVAGTIDDEVKALIDRAYAHCKNILTENADKLNAVVDFLMEHESMTGEQFEAIMEGKAVGDASTTAMFDGFEEPEKTEVAE